MHAPSVTNRFGTSCAWFLDLALAGSLLLRPGKAR